MLLILDKQKSINKNFMRLNKEKSSLFDMKFLQHYKNNI